MRKGCLVAVAALAVGCAQTAPPPIPVPAAASHARDESPASLTDTRVRELDAFIRHARAEIARDAGDPHDKAWVVRQLKAMVQLDQTIRRAVASPNDGESVVAQHRLMNAIALRMMEQDALDTRALKSMLDVHGWITISTFGAEAEHDAWLLVQHADADRAFQREVLARLESLVPRGETSPKSYAYLFDRVAVADQRSQRFGTQGRCTAPHRWEPFPVEDGARLDERRASVGLGPHAEYAASFETVCASPL
jgi:hypothetical protein